MKTMKLFAGVVLAIASVFAISSCDDSDDFVWYYPPTPDAVVTVKPIEGAGFYMQLDDSTTLYPVNMASSFTSTWSYHSELPWVF